MNPYRRGNYSPSAARLEKWMKTRNRQSHGWFAWALVLALVGVTSSSGASWQCPDGHLCPPGCRMSAHSPADAGQEAPECEHCKLAAKAKASISSAGCTSPNCVLRVSPKPDSLTAAKVFLAIDTTAFLPAPAVAPRLSASTSPSFSLAPLPPRAGGTSPHSPRAPPSSTDSF